MAGCGCGLGKVKRKKRKSAKRKRGVAGVYTSNLKLPLRSRPQRMRDEREVLKDAARRVGRHVVKRRAVDAPSDSEYGPEWRPIRRYVPRLENPRWAGAQPKVMTSAKELRSKRGLKGGQYRKGIPNQWLESSRVVEGEWTERAATKSAAKRASTHAASLKRTRGSKPRVGAYAQQGAWDRYSRERGELRPSWRAPYELQSKKGLKGGFTPSTIKCPPRKLWAGPAAVKQAAAALRATPGVSHVTAGTESVHFKFPGDAADLQSVAPPLVRSLLRGKWWDACR